jgi:hypothetical protein
VKAIRSVLYRSDFFALSFFRAFAMIPLSSFAFIRVDPCSVFFALFATLREILLRRSALAVASGRSLNNRGFRLIAP